MTSLVKRSLAALALTAGVGVSAFAVASPAQAAGCDIQVWTDGTTIGVACPGPSAYLGSYQTVATCKNGLKVYGETVHAPKMSYAYCSSVNSTVDSWVVDFGGW
jgi:hypothetical protein